MLESKHRRGGSTSLTTAIRACADRLATFHICRFSEQLNRLLIVHLTHLLPAYPRSLLAAPQTPAGLSPCRSLRATRKKPPPATTILCAPAPGHRRKSGAACRTKPFVGQRLHPRTCAGERTA